MSQYPPQPPPYGAPPPYAPPPKKPRPRAVWFVVGGVLLALAPLVFVGALFSVLRPLTQEDAVFRADQTPITVELPANEERALYNDPGDPADCTATDGSGQEIEFRSVTGDFSYQSWTALARFDTGDGNVTFECSGTSPSSEIRVAQLPSTGTFILGLLVGLIVPMVLGLTGFVILIVTGILWASRPPRSQTLPTTAPPPSEPTSGPGTPAS